MIRRFMIFMTILWCGAGAYGAPVRTTGVCPYGHTVTGWDAVPVEPSRIYIDVAEKFARDGNTYWSGWNMLTNIAAWPPGTEIGDYLATNRFPVKRVNVELSTDGGSNYTRRIATGVQVNPDHLNGEFTWSPATDYSLLSEQAYLRLTDLDGHCFNNGPTNAPFTFNRAPGKYVESGKFTVSGSIVIDPAAGDIVYAGSLMTVSFYQFGGGAVYDLAWASREDPYFHIFATASNCVGGVINTSVGLCTIPVAPEVVLFVSSQADRVIRGHSEVFSVE